MHIGYSREPFVVYNKKIDTKYKKERQVFIFLLWIFLFFPTFIIFSIFVQCTTVTYVIYYLLLIYQKKAMKMYCKKHYFLVSCKFRLLFIYFFRKYKPP